jgi:hypothetical protein
MSIDLIDTKTQSCPGFIVKRALVNAGHPETRAPLAGSQGALIFCRSPLIPLDLSIAQ